MKRRHCFAQTGDCSYEIMCTCTDNAFRRSVGRLGERSDSPESVRNCVPLCFHYLRPGAHSSSPTTLGRRFEKKMELRGVWYGCSIIIRGFEAGRTLNCFCKNRSGVLGQLIETAGHFKRKRQRCFWALIFSRFNVSKKFAVYDILSKNCFRPAETLYLFRLIMAHPFLCCNGALEIFRKYI